MKKIRLSPAVFVAGVLTLMCAIPAAAADKIKIYIKTDLEGVSGVYKFAQSREKGTPAEQQGLRVLHGRPRRRRPRPPRRGADEVVVIDGHGTRRSSPTSSSRAPSTSPARLGRVRPLGPRRDLRRDGHVRRPRHEGHARRHPQPYPVVEDGEPLLVQRRRIRGTGPVRARRRPLRRADDPRHRRHGGLPRSTKFFGTDCVTVAVKEGISREAASSIPWKKPVRPFTGGQESRGGHTQVQALCPRDADQSQNGAPRLRCERNQARHRGMDDRGRPSPVRKIALDLI